jgi:hypothetical protein
MENFDSASKAYNEAMDRASNDLLVFAHQDVYFPDGWFSALSATIAALDRQHIRWGVLGSFGSSRSIHGGAGRVYTNGRGLHGNSIQEPTEIETLDEIVLVLRKSSGLRFDESLPNFHLYGTDICLIAQEAGYRNFAIPGLCIHNTHQLITLPREFYACYRHIKRKWSRRLPIYASCMKISRFDESLLIKKFQEFKAEVLGNAKGPRQRVNDPRSLLEQCAAESNSCRA